MAKTWSWGEVASNKRKKSTGGNSGSSASPVGNSGNFYVGSDLKYEMGDMKRLTIPFVEDEEGNRKMIIYSAPVHGIEELGFIKLEGPKGGVYSPYSIRCMGALAQVDYAKGREIAERGQYCTLCTLANLQKTARFAKIEEKYGSVEAFKAVPKENPEKIAFISELNSMNKVRESYNSEKKETFYDTFILVLELESEKTMVQTDFGEEEATFVKKDNNGLPLWRPTLFKASPKRLEKFQKALSEAGRTKQLRVDSLYPFVDQTGEEVKTAFVDFQLYFPLREKKMNSASDLEIRAMSSEESVITPEFVQSILDNSKVIMEKAQIAWEKSYLRYQDFTNEEFVSAMVDKGAYLNTLKERYLTQRDVTFAHKVLETAKGNNLFAKDAEEKETVEQEAPEVPTEMPVKDNSDSVVVEASTALANDLLNMDFTL